MTLSPLDYGCSAADLEALRQIVERSCPLVRFKGFTASSARFGEYIFCIPPGAASSYFHTARVQAPVTPAGSPRARLGLWRYRLNSGRRVPHSWVYARSIETVADWLCRTARRLRGEDPL